MLVLTRKRFESVRINGNITITVLKTDRGRVKVAIEAPQHVRILRGELVPDDPNVAVDFSFPPHLLEDALGFDEDDFSVPFAGTVS